MKTALTTILITFCSVSISFAGIFAATVIDSTTQIDLKLFATIGGFVCGVVVPGIIWLTRKLQRIEDTLENIQKDMNQRPCMRNEDCTENYK